MAVYRTDPPPERIVETNTIIERDSWYSEPWTIALILGAIAIIGLIAYWAMYTPNQPTYVSNTTIERAPGSGRAQQMSQPNPPVVVNPPAVTVNPPAVNVNPPANPPIIVNPPNNPSTPPSNTTSGNSGNNGNGTSGNGGNGNSGNDNGAGSNTTGD